VKGAPAGSFPGRRAFVFRSGLTLPGGLPEDSVQGDPSGLDRVLRFRLAACRRFEAGPYHPAKNNVWHHGQVTAGRMAVIRWWPS
jgi:hypothetical protein